MSRTQAFVKDTFNDYFDRLKEIAQTIEALKKLSNDCAPDQQQKIKKLIGDLENELRNYATKLKSGGTEIIKRVA